MGLPWQSQGRCGEYSTIFSEWELICPEYRIVPRNRRQRRGDKGMTFLLKGGLLHCPAERWFAAQPETKPSLYARPGGVYSVATAVDDLIDRVMVDPRLNANRLVDESALGAGAKA